MAGAVTTPVVDEGLGNLAHLVDMTDGRALADATGLALDQGT